MSLVLALGTGLALGLKHAAEPDHVAAVATLLRRDQGLRGAARIGTFWGLGHSLVLIAAGALLQFTGLRVPARFSTFAELGVCAMLVVLGALGLRRARGAHTHGHRTARSAVGIGALHGLAGSSAAALLAAASAGSLGPLAFLVLFSVGTVAGMAATTAVLSVPLARAAQNERWQRALVRTACWVSIVLGLVLGALLVRGA